MIASLTLEGLSVSEPWIMSITPHSHYIPPFNKIEVKQVLPLVQELELVE